MVKGTSEFFQMMYCMAFHLKGHHIYQMLNLKQNVFFSRSSLNLQILIFLMPIEIKRNRLSHLKAFNMQMGMVLVVLLSSTTLS